MTDLTIKQADASTVAALPHVATLQEIKIYSHSTLLYWWPAWALGFLCALLNAGQEQFLTTAEGTRPSSAIALSYVSVLLLLIIFTSIRLRGLNSVVALLTIGFVAVLLAWFGWWDSIANVIRYLWVHMNTGFLSRVLDGAAHHWLLMFFVFDRMTYGRYGLAR